MRQYLFLLFLYVTSFLLIYSTSVAQKKFVYSNLSLEMSPELLFQNYAHSPITTNNYDNVHQYTIYVAKEEIRDYITQIIADIINGQITSIKIFLEGEIGSKSRYPSCEFILNSLIHSFGEPDKSDTSWEERMKTYSKLWVTENNISRHIFPGMLLASDTTLFSKKEILRLSCDQLDGKGNIQAVEIWMMVVGNNFENHLPP